MCVSQGVLRFSRDVARLDPARLTVIPNGIDPRPFDCASPLHAPRSEFRTMRTWLFTSAVSILKRATGSLKAAEQVISQRPDWHLALAGDGPCRDWLLDQLANRPDCEKGFTGWAGATIFRTCSNQPMSWCMPRSGKACPTLFSRRWLPALPSSEPPSKEPKIWSSRPDRLACSTSRLTGALPVLCSRPLIHPSVSRYGDAGRRRVEEEFSLETTVTAYEHLWAGVLGLRVPARTNAGSYCCRADDDDKMTRRWKPGSDECYSLPIVGELAKTSRSTVVG